MSYTCPRCGMTSHHPVDERVGWCGNCEAFTRGDLPEQLLELAAAYADAEPAVQAAIRRRVAAQFGPTTGTGN